MRLAHFEIRMPRRKKKITFEESIESIDTELQKRKNRWNLTSLSWMDYDDVSQIIRIHIYKKWDLYDQSKPLAPWLNRIISNQIKNIIRNNYGNYARPCLKCSASDGEEGCEIYVKQCVDCPLYEHWFKNKKRAHDTKLPVSLENHPQEIYNKPSDSFDIEVEAMTLHNNMKKILKPIEWRVYNLLYIQNKTENEVAKEMGYVTSEKNRQPGYKQIKNIKKSIIKKVKQLISE
jgi:RNA polymerase sigma factor (sigma-70 family)